MARDYYEESESIASELQVHGDAAAAQAVRDAISGGSTASEILSGLRHEFGKLIAEPITEPLLTQVVELRNAIDSALA